MSTDPKRPLPAALATLLAALAAPAAEPGRPAAFPTHPVGRCGEPSVAIHTIQGAGPSSPRRGDGGVVVEGIVVGDFQGTRGLRGFFVQSGDAEVDDDPATSQGLFVFEPSDRHGPDVSVGDRVRVRGEIREFFGATEIAVEDGVVRCGRAPLPRAVTLPLPRSEAGTTSSWERFEGMRVRIPTPLTVSGQFAQEPFGELVLAHGGRLLAPTAVAPPGPAALHVAARHDRLRLVLDDGSRRRRPEPIPYRWRSDGAPTRLGDVVHDLEGVLDYAFGRFRLHPTAPVTITPGAATYAAPAPPPVRGRLRVVAWNVENHFNGDGRGGGFPTRGPRTAGEADRQRAKIVETLVALDADVLALVELENDGIGPRSTVDDLIAALAARDPRAAYVAVDPGSERLGSDAIAVALLYRPATALPIGRPAVLDATVDPDFETRRHRPSLAASFRARSLAAPHGRVTVAVHHWKSKGSSCASSGDPDLGDGAGHCNATRRRAARATVRWLASGPTGIAADAVLTVGDLNSYAREEPLRELERGGFVDVLAASGRDEAHTFVFDGAAGRLDHAHLHGDGLHTLADAAVWHTNADWPEWLDYREGRPDDAYRRDPIRASDHDPLAIDLFRDGDGDGVPDANDACPGTPVLGPAPAGCRAMAPGDPDPQRVDARGCLPRAQRGRRRFAGVAPPARIAARPAVALRSPTTSCVGPVRRAPLRRRAPGTPSWSRPLP